MVENQENKLFDNLSKITETESDSISSDKIFVKFDGSLLGLIQAADVEWKTVQEIFTLKNGYTPSKSKPEYWENGDVPWFRMEDIRTNGHILSDAIQKCHHTGIKGQLFSAGSIIMATTATIGEHAMITVDYMSNQQFTNFTIKEEYRELLDDKFIFYYFYVLDDVAKNNLNQSSMPSVQMDALKKADFPIPSLEIQQKVVEILDKMTDYVTELTAELTLRQKQYSFYRDQLLTFPSQSDSDESLLVRWMTIDGIAKKVSSGGTPKTGTKEYYDGEIPWLRTQEINFGEIWDTGVKITEAGVKNSSAKWIPENCVIVAMYGATVGKIGINKIPLTTNQACANIEVDEEQVDYRYVFHYLTNQYEYIKSLGTGSQTNINAQIIKNLKIAVPPLKLQSKIVKILDKFQALTADVSGLLPEEIALRQKQYAYYREQLLTFSANSAKASH
ncbi:MAG: restriction endonuclease subunit S [Streptococcaceae bacterium]|jgi:type I restriction enzyme S subunit|nr:restriction endonuclease subunit S [Streptococcaceae bacterium]